MSQVTESQAEPQAHDCLLLVGDGEEPLSGARARQLPAGTVAGMRRVVGCSFVAGIATALALVAVVQLVAERVRATGRVEPARGMLDIGGDAGGCFTQGRAYGPIDMDGVIPVAASGAAECQSRCAKQPFCFYFSFDHMSMVCHLEDSSAVMQNLSLPFISGPAVCPSSTAGPTAPATTTAAAVRSTPASSKTLQAAATTLAATTTTTTEPTTTTPRSTLPTTTTTEYQPSLFCFLMLMPTGYEPELVRAQVAKRAGVFSCDQHAAFSTAVIDLGGGVVTTKIGAESKKGSWGSWLNTDNFLQAWDKILAEGRFRKSDWAVKADPDCVFFPDRLKLHLQMLFPGGADDGFYIKNCPKSFGFMGSLEIISTNGVDAYAKHKDYCRKNMNAAGSGEDGFMQACLKYSGVVGKEDFSLLVDHYCGFGKCEGNTKNVAFHPFKDTNGWFQCWSQVTAAR